MSVFEPKHDVPGDFGYVVFVLEAVFPGNIEGQRISARSYYLISLIFLCASGLPEAQHIVNDGHLHCAIQ